MNLKQNWQIITDIYGDKFKGDLPWRKTLVLSMIHGAVLGFTLALFVDGIVVILYYLGLFPHH